MDGQPGESGIRGAGFWVRAVAHAVDLTLLMTLACLISVPLALHHLAGGSEGLPDWVRWAEIPVDILLVLGIVALWRFTQTTPGKRLLGLRIVDARTGGRPGWMPLLVRYLAYLLALLPVVPLRMLERFAPGVLDVPLYREYFGGWVGWVTGVPLGFGFLWILVDRRNRGWHDLISGTLTVADRPQ